MVGSVVRFCRATFLLLMTIGVGALAPTAAVAHAALISTDPADGSVLDVAPGEVVVTFNEPVSPISASVLSSGGVTTAVEPMAHGPRIVIALPALSTGTHLVSYRVVSDDGHPIGGTIAFSIGQATAISAPIADVALPIAIWLTRAILYACLFLGVGSAAFSLVAGSFAARRTALVLSAAGLVAVPVAAMLQGLDLLGRPLALASSEAVSVGLASSYGATLIAFALAFASTLAAFAVGASRLRTVLIIGAACAGAAAPALSGHAATADPQWLTRPAVAVHVAALLFWIGALVPLRTLLRSESPQAPAVLSRFSSAIPWAVGALLVAGLALAFVQLGPPGPAWLAPYGLILATKLGLVACLLGLALWNRRALTKPALAGRVPARRMLGRNIATETVLAIVILALVAGWRLTPPPRALAAVETSAASAVTEMLHGQQAMAHVTISPAAPGPVRVTVDLMDIDGVPMTAKALTVTFSQEATGVVGLRRDAAVADSGSWEAEGIVLPSAGEWAVTLAARIDDFTMDKLSGTVTLPEQGGD